MKRQYGYGPTDLHLPPGLRGYAAVFPYLVGERGEGVLFTDVIALTRDGPTAQRIVEALNAAEVIVELPPCPNSLDFREPHRGPSRQHATDAAAARFQGKC